MSAKLIRLFKTILPAPFTIAVLLTIVTLVLAFFLSPEEYNLIELLSFWESGLWNNSLLVFAVQMMLMLVLGHVLALSRFISRIIETISQFCKNTALAAALVTFLTLLVSFFNINLNMRQLILENL